MIALQEQHWFYLKHVNITQKEQSRKVKRGEKVVRVYVFAFNSPWCLFLPGIYLFTFEFLLILDL